MRGAFVIAVVCSGAGCDGVFGLTEVHANGDGAAPDACVRIGHDEDLDAIDDGCDPCPFGPNDIDDDGDGIALACDPDPATRNQVLLFTGFGPGSSDQFEMRGLTIANDALHASIPSIDNNYLLWGTDVDEVFITAGVTILATDAAAQYRELMFVFEAGPLAIDVDGTYCGFLGHNGGSPPDYAQIWSSEGTTADTVINTQASTLPLDQFGTGTMRASYSRNRAPQTSCVFSRPGFELQVSGTRTPLPAPGRFGIFIDDVAADIPYLFIVAKSVNP